MNCATASVRKETIMKDMKQIFDKSISDEDLDIFKKHAQQEAERAIAPVITVEILREILIELRELKDIVKTLKN